MATLVHVPQLIIPLSIILYISNGKPSGYGFNLKEDPPEFSHKRMLFIGSISGLVLSVQYFVRILNGSPIEIPQPVNLVNVLGNLGFQWIIVGLSEETMFRGLIQTYFMENLEGYVNIADHRIHIGTVIGALFWGGFHIINVLNMPLSSAVLTVLITAPIGVLLGYGYQRTGSLLTTILVHNTLFGVPVTIGYLLYFIGF
jgi:membrane protease YdiL (CAAX protease family)